MSSKDAQLLSDWLVRRYGDPITRRHPIKHAASMSAIGKNRHRARTLRHVAE
jgi:hypothetical protein